MNLKFIELEKKISEDLETELNYLLPDYITKVTHHFVMPTVSRRGLKNVQRLKHAKGLTLLLLHREGKSPLFTYVVCDNEDTFSRLVGHNFVYEKAIALLKNKSWDKFEYINNAINDKGEVVKDVAVKIANKVVNRLNAPPKTKEVKRIPSSTEVLNILAGSKDLDVAAVFYKHFNYQPYGYYPNHLKPSNTRFYGAVTFVTVVTKTCEVLKGVAICQPGDNFSRERGRSFALQSIVKNTASSSLKKVQKLQVPKELKNFMKEKGFITDETI